MGAKSSPRHCTCAGSGESSSDLGFEDNAITNMSSFQLDPSLYRLLIE